MNRSSLICAAMFIAISATGSELVTKVAEPFEGPLWSVDPYAMAKGKTSLSSEVAPGTDSKKSLEIEAHWEGGKGFQWFAVKPVSAIAIPGELKSVRVRVRSSDPRLTFALKFKDGWGRIEVDKKKLEHALIVKNANEWTTIDFKVPPDWVQPVSIDSVLAHNWDFQNEARTIHLWLDHLEATTDISNVDPETGVLKTWKPNTGETDPKKQVKEPPKTPLVSTDLSMNAVCNVFAGAEPSVTVSVRNWKPAALTGKLQCEVTDLSGQKIDTQEQPVSVESAASLSFPIKVEKFGLYNLTASLTLAGAAPRTQKIAFAKLPATRQLTEAQKRASPYGLNVHGGSDNQRLEPFAAAGLVWFRDYAFNWEWMLRAKGNDKHYAGWPYFPTLAKRYEDLGVKLLPCLMGAIKPPVAPASVPAGRDAGATFGPDRAWATELADILSAFPKITHWELSNEYDLVDNHAKAEEAIRWANYRAYHKKFAEVINVLTGGEVVAVENGRAGIWPERAKDCVSSGDFAGIGVINTHHYCGIEAPEVNYGNFNTGFETLRRDEAPSLFFDRLRAVKRVAVSDGKPRESWLTEFGWDTLAGNVVTPYEQAAFLPRAWLLALAAGTDKCFWFFNYDAAKSQQFFDGCGLLAFDGSPKLSLCALAGLTALMPNPKCVGEISAGENTWGYVFESEGKLVAALWAIDGRVQGSGVGGQGNGPEVTFNAEQLHDYLGNKLAGKSAKLGLAPVYAVGLSKDDPLYKQTAFSLDSPYLVVATAGDQITATLRIQNNQAAQISGSAQLKVPEGWSAATADYAFKVQPGEKMLLPMQITVSPKEGIGQKTVKIAIPSVKEIPLQVLVQQALIMQVGPIMGQPGKADINVKIGNQSAKTVDGTLTLKLPAAWKAITAEQKVEGLKSGEIRDVKCSLEWSADWKTGESAMAVFATADGKSAQRPIIPKSLRLHKAPALKMDGKLDDWPAACELPPWLLGCTLGEAKARAFLAWSPDGLYGAVDVHDSKLSAADPRSFWNGDCLELFVDTADNKAHREYDVGDHQFWLVPQVDEHRVYAGRWKRKNEIAETQYDVQGVKSYATKTEDGYTMEFFLPASALQKYQPKVGAHLGVSVNLTVKGQRFSREVYWPWTKTDWALANWPKMWGSVELAE
ncbi:MAG TPA: sugar-binding protein [Planctomycetota bacterium]|jgi:hypothetical protein